MFTDFVYIAHIRYEYSNIFIGLLSILCAVNLWFMFTIIYEDKARLTYLRK